MSLADRIQHYWKAIKSGRTADERTIALRQLSCFGDPEAGVPPCPDLSGEAPERYCGACKCGRRASAILDKHPVLGFSKLEFGYLHCPRARPGFSNHEVTDG